MFSFELHLSYFKHDNVCIDDGRLMLLLLIAYCTVFGGVSHVARRNSRPSPIGWFVFVELHLAVNQDCAGLPKGHYRLRSKDLQIALFLLCFR